MTLMPPGSRVKLVAPVTVQDKVEDCPGEIVLGEAVNEAITGNPGGGGVGVGVGVGVGEPPFVVVNVRSPDVDGLPAWSVDFTL